MLRSPTIEDLSKAAAAYGMDVPDDDLVIYQSMSEGIIAALGRLDQLSETKPLVKYPRVQGHRPGPEENPRNAWYWKCSIKGASSGKLAGKRIVVKDNICVAGIPMMNGSLVLEGYIPDIDASVVTRVLDAGGEIVGKAVCESLCLSGGSHLADTGPIHNPHKQGYSSGGSSSGSAVLVATGEADMSIAADQAGSIRVPSSWSGLFGLKPTFGLVPYTGASSLEFSIDHIGPITRTAMDSALLLEVLAGPDGLDPRQPDVRPQQYTKALTGDVKGVRIGIVDEGFGLDGTSEKDVDEVVRDAAHKFERLGAKVTTLSMPEHLDGSAIFMGVGVEGVTSTLGRDQGMGRGWKGYYTTSLMKAYGAGMKTCPNDLSPTTKLMLLLGDYLLNNYDGQYYAKAQNLTASLRKAYDQALSKVDLLVMPTTPMKAQPLPEPTASLIEKIARSMQSVANTCPFNLTGHPALNVPCGTSDGLPVGMMLVGRHGEDAIVLRAGDAFEQHG
ncbi:MAG: Asp-tRNA(Asn)/Glu-tRNA(Gln) amidotransferase GatCAB subunit A [Acidobacteria bacterium]|nr:MAG: Asp-tRNA(Asn)/Glu-tRNA(Gln) amidotransferase GatCAB subunit A [Acidobacteriota bacterium]